MEETAQPSNLYSSKGSATLTEPIRSLTDEKLEDDSPLIITLINVIEIAKSVHTPDYQPKIPFRRDSGPLDKSRVDFTPAQPKRPCVSRMKEMNFEASLLSPTGTLVHSVSESLFKKISAEIDGLTDLDLMMSGLTTSPYSSTLICKTRHNRSVSALSFGSGESGLDWDLHERHDAVLSNCGSLGDSFGPSRWGGESVATFAPTIAFQDLQENDEGDANTFAPTVATSSYFIPLRREEPPRARDNDSQVSFGPVKDVAFVPRNNGTPSHRRNVSALTFCCEDEVNTWDTAAFSEDFTLLYESSKPKRHHQDSMLLYTSEASCEDFDENVNRVSATCA
jgi:hypothetical protein